MEGLTNPYKSVSDVDYTIFEDCMECSGEGLYFIVNENFNLKKKIKKLNSIIIKVLNKLKDFNSDNKEILINTISEKQNLLKDILKEFNEIKDKFMEYDEFYREEVFQFYKKEYNHIIFNIFAKNKILSIGIDIQNLLKKKFYDFLSNYFALIDKFILINNYIVKVKILLKE